MNLFGRSVRLFTPILAGATLHDRMIAAGGAVGCLAIAAMICDRVGFLPPGLPALIAPMGASAVLLFAVPASPLAQPWSILGGNVVSALVGVAAAQGLGHGAVALGVAAGAAILAMSFLRCLHPPGGAIAMTAVVGGPAVWSAGLAFPLVLVALNAVVLIALGWAFHRLSGHAYPHRVRPSPAPPTPRPHFVRSDIERALADVGETFDVSSEDLEVLLERAEHYASQRPAMRPT